MQVGEERQVQDGHSATYHGNGDQTIRRFLVHYFRQKSFRGSSMLLSLNEDCASIICLFLKFKEIGDLDRSYRS